MYVWSCKDEVCLKFKALLEPFDITRYYTACFSKTKEMHDLVTGLFINRYGFGKEL